MGYESRFIVGTAHRVEPPLRDHPGGRWVSVHADFYLGRLPYNSIFHGSLLGNGDNTQDFFFYSRDGEEEVEVREDCYGRKLEKFDFEEIIVAFQEDWNEGIISNSKIPPFLAALQMYQNLEEDFRRPELGAELVLLHYGY